MIPVNGFPPLQPTPVIDAHHHLWHYTEAEFGWIDERMALLRRDFTVDDLAVAMRTAGVDHSVAVQARQSLDETDMLLAVATTHPSIAGVVGWLPLAEGATLDAVLDRYADNSLLVGCRHVVQVEPDGFLEEVNFNRGVSALSQAGLTYDLLVRADQLEEAARFVDRHPRQAFILDHLAKPKIADGLLEPWSQHLRELAQRENVSCKLSGMVTKDDWRRWSAESLRPYLDVAVDAFGTSRLMVGSDWPVCLVATDYARWWKMLHGYFAGFSRDEENAIFGGNAIRVYSLSTIAKVKDRTNNDAGLKP